MHASGTHASSAGGREPSKKALQSDRTRRALLDVAQQLFAERGYEDTFIDEIARRARMTKGALYHQFRDKRELFEAVLGELVVGIVEGTRDRAEQVVAPGGRGRSSTARAHAGIEILLDRLCEPAVRQILILDGPSVLGRERWQELLAPVQRGLVRAIFRSARERGRLAPDLVDPLTTMFFGALLEVAAVIGHAEDPEATRAGVAMAARWTLERLLPADEDAG
jgi:AcrR family transcriptional regulator